MEKIKFKKDDIIRVINVLKEQDESSENVIRVSPEEIQKLLKFSDYSMDGISKLRKFRDKKIIVTGDLDLSDTSIKTMGSIVKIEGRLNISGTEIATVNGIEVTGHINDYGSRLAKIRHKKFVDGLRAEAQSRREDNDWSIENADGVGMDANAVFMHLQDVRSSSVRSEDDENNLRQLKERLGNLFYDQEQGNDSDEVQDEIDKLEADIEEIEEKIDVYELIPSTYSHYGKMSRFEIYVGDLTRHEYAAGTEAEVEKAALEYAEEYIDEYGPTSFNEHFYMDHLNEEGILDYFRDFYEDDVRNNPDVYFNDDDFELTQEQEDRKEELENYIEEMEQLKSDTEDEQRDLENSDSEEYAELEEKINEIQENIDTSQTELDNIEVDTDPTEEMIDKQVESMLDDVEYDYKAKLDEFGMDISDWIDKDSLAQAWVDEDGFGIMNHYDGGYDSQYINGTEYIVIRVN